MARHRKRSSPRASARRASTRRRAARRPPAVAAPSAKYRLTVEFKRFKGKDRDSAGVCRQYTEKDYAIAIDTDERILSQVGTLFHEFGHFLIWTLFSSRVGDKGRIEEFCDAVDRSAQRAFKKFLGVERK